MTLNRRRLLVAGAGLAASTSGLRAQPSAPLRIGVLNDASGPLRDTGDGRRRGEGRWGGRGGAHEGDANR